MWYVADASEYLVITGLFINDIKIAKKAWVLVGQKCGRINVKPMPYEFQIQARSSEKLEFLLPANYTIGPNTQNMDSLSRYARLVAPMGERHHRKVIETIQAIVEGQTRALAANMALEEIFRGTEEFQRQVKQLVQRELEPFGLVVYTANVLQLQEVEGRPYLSYLAMKAQKDAENKAKMDVAAANFRGDVGAREQEGMREREMTSLDANTSVYNAERTGEVERRKAEVETETKVRVSESKAIGATAENEWEVKKAQLEKETALAKIEAEKATELKEAELRRDVERMRGLAATEKSRAELVVKSVIEREATQEAAKGAQFKMEREAEAALFKRKMELEARQEAARAAAFARKESAVAFLREGEAVAEVWKRRAKAFAYTITTISWAILHVVVAVTISYFLLCLIGSYRRSPTDFGLVPSPSPSPNYVFTPKAIINLLLHGAPLPPLPPSQPFDPSSPTSPPLPTPMALDQTSSVPSPSPFHSDDPLPPTHNPQGASLDSHEHSASMEKNPSDKEMSVQPKLINSEPHNMANTIGSPMQTS